MLAWGENDHGSLGDGSNVDGLTPASAAPLPGGRMAVAVAGGYYHSLALADDSSLWACGYGGDGQLGNGTTASASIPDAVIPLPSGRTAVAVTAGDRHSLVLDDDGMLWAWGNNDAGALGDGSTSDRNTPVAVTSLPEGRKVVDIAAGRQLSLALADDGSLWSWGTNNFAQLGNGAMENSSVPVAVDPLPGGRTSVKIAAGRYHCLALADDGSLWAWGNNHYGQLGDNSTTDRGSPVAVSPLPEGRVVVDIAAGSFHNLALADDGTLWAWGDNDVGQLGNGSTVNSSFPIAVNPLPEGRRAVFISVGNHHNLVQADDDSLWAWGYNSGGQLGNGSTENSLVPLQVSDLPEGRTAVMFASGGYHNLVIGWWKVRTGVTQTGWLLTAAANIEVQNIVAGEVNVGSQVSVYRGGSYLLSAYLPGVFGQPDSWNPSDFVINEGEQFVFETAGGGDGYLSRPFAYVGDWRLTAPSGTASVSGDVTIEWEAYNVSSIPDTPPPEYAAKVTITGDNAYEEDLGLIRGAESVVWHSQELPDGNYTIHLTIVDSPFEGVEGIAVETITKEITLENPRAQGTHYVDLNSPSPTPPYTTWATAATSIQAAVNAAVEGEPVVVTNGHYALDTEINVSKNIAIASVNGPAQTIVDGQGSVRCFNLSNSECVISGLTITNGYVSGSGGGIYCTGTNPMVSNCVISGNTVTLVGGGVYSGTMTDCILSENLAGIRGGGVCDGVMMNCKIAQNTAGDRGGGIYNSTARNCLIYDNQANGVDSIFDGGGGMYAGTAYNCTIISNRAPSGAGGGSLGGTLNNCIVWYNAAFRGDSFFSSSVSYTCSSAVTHGTHGNITNAPAFIDADAGNYHLLIGSPCINAGSNGFVSTSFDLDGNPRVIDDTVDMGAYECQSVAVSEISVKAASVFLTDGGTQSFGNQAVGTPKVQTFKISNEGVADLAGLGITKDGTDAPAFEVGPLDTTNLGNGESTTFRMTFIAPGVGSHTAVIHIASNDPDENPFDIILTGTGLVNSDTDPGSDVWEIANGFDPGVDGDVMTLDSDGDGIADILEIFQGTERYGNWIPAAVLAPMAINNETALNSPLFESVMVDSNGVLKVQYRCCSTQTAVNAESIWSDDLTDSWRFSGESSSGTVVTISESVVSNGPDFEIIETSSEVTSGNVDALFYALELTPNE